MTFHILTLKSCVLTAWLLFSLRQSATAQGNLVINGGFDTSPAGWTLMNGASWPWGGNPGPAVGLDFGTGSNDPTASQTINGLVPGIAYVVSGEYQVGKDRSEGSPMNPSFGVALDGAFLFEAFAPGDGAWHSFSFSYSPASPSAILSLSSQINGTGWSYMIDNIAVQEIPEPSALSLWCLGVATLFMLKRLRRQ